MQFSSDFEEKKTLKECKTLKRNVIKGREFLIEADVKNN